MILVHRLKGEPLFVNSDLIDTIEATPDTVVSLADGRKIMVAESPEDVVDAIRRYRASVIVATDELRELAGHTADLVMLPGAAESD
ncbi:MAG: flagellar FlbD family protein [Actinomycetota bacterium]